MRKNRLSKTISKFKKIIIIVFAVTILGFTAISISSTTDRLEPAAVTESPKPSQLTNDFQSPTPQTAVQWDNQNFNEVTTPHGNILKLPDSYKIYQPSNRQGGSTYITHRKQIYNEAYQYISVYNEKNGEKLSLTEKTESIIENIGDNILIRYETYPEKIEGAIAATTEYRTKNQSRFYILTIVYTPPIFHHIIISQDISANDTRKTLQDTLLYTRSQVLKNYRMHDSRINNSALSNDIKEDLLTKRNTEWYEKFKR